MAAVQSFEDSPRPWSQETTSEDRLFTLVRHCHPSGEGFPRHSHTYLECFWIESGTYLHECDGVTTQLQAGDMVFITPPTEHHGRGSGTNGGVLVNVAFPASLVSGMAADFGYDWPWKSGVGKKFQLSRANRSLLQQWVTDIQPPNNTRVNLLAFLAAIARMVAGHANDDRTYPLWLEAALRAFSTNDPLPTGIDPFVGYCGRSMAYISRQIHAITGLSTTHFLNQVRLDHAAMWLHHTADPIDRIAVRCGITNLPHFYRLFRHRFSVTPAQFRASPNEQQKKFIKTKRFDSSMRIMA